MLSLKRSVCLRFPAQKMPYLLPRPVRATAPTKESIMLPGISLQFEPFYRVILVYSDWLNDKPVAQKVRYSVPIITSNDAMNVTRRARVEGRSIIVTVIKDDAILYMTNLKNKGLDVILDEA